MVRSVLADDTLLPYLQKLSKDYRCCIGLILGQTTALKDYVIHFAKTPPLQNNDKDQKHDDEVTFKDLKSIDDVSENWVADHAKHATRMLPGGMHVLGIFVVSKEDLLNPFAAKFRAILSATQKTLSTNQYINGNPDTQDKLVLNYCTATSNFNCKSYNVTTSSVKPAEFKFQPKAMKWITLECKYDLDQTFPLYEGKVEWPLKRHLQEILEHINEHFKSAVYLFDNEIKEPDETLELIGKKKKIAKFTQNKEKSENKSIDISIFMPCEMKHAKDLKIRATGGFIRIVGQVSSKLWLCPKLTIDVASTAIAQDIIRSLGSRLEMHWDSLIDEESGSAEDINSLHEPPRRVLIQLPENKIMMSDYLFPGEGANEALISLQELLDIKINNEKNIIDIEGQPDLNEIYPREEPLQLIDNEENLPIQLPADANKFMYMVAVIVALIVLIISLLIHYLQAY